MAVRGLSVALLVAVLILIPTAASAHHGRQRSTVQGTWTDPVGACVAHIVSFDAATGDFVCTGTSDWTGTWTGSTTWTFTGNQNATTGALSGRVDEVFTGHAPDGRGGTLTFVERITIDPAGKTDIRGRIVAGSGKLAGSHGHARWTGTTNPADGSGSGIYFGRWHEGRAHKRHHRLH